MAKKKKEKTRIVNLYITPSTFSTIFKRLSGDKSDYDLAGLKDLRKVLNDEKAKILNTIKNEEPTSIYDLAKKLGRDFKSVRKDIKLLERFGFIELKPGTTGKRKKLRPQVIIDNLQVNISFQ